MVYLSRSSVSPAFAVVSMESRHIKSSGRLVGRLTGVSRIFLSLIIFNNPSTQASSPSLHLLTPTGGNNHDVPPSKAPQMIGLDPLETLR